MYIQGLIDAATSSPSTQTVKQIIENICYFNPIMEQFESLADCKCFPIKLSNGTLEWMDSKGDFAIVDRRAHGRLFSGKINVLDFNLEELHSFEKFFRGLDLQKQYTS